jgi:hypothetical protein
MFKNANEALAHLKKWLKERGTPEPYTPVISIGGLWRNGRIVWKFDMRYPLGIYYVYSDTGEVEEAVGAVVKVN